MSLFFFLLGNQFLSVLFTIFITFGGVNYFNFLFSLLYKQKVVRLLVRVVNVALLYGPVRRTNNQSQGASRQISCLIEIFETVEMSRTKDHQKN